MDRTVLYLLSYGLYAIGVMDGTTPQGCIVNTVFQITSKENGTIALSMNKDNYTHGVIQREGVFAVSILSEETPPINIGKLGFASGANVEKFKELEYELADGLPILNANCSGYLRCRVTGSYDMDTHTVFFAEIEDAWKTGTHKVMTYEYYHTVIKGKAPKNAPTYQGD